MKKTLKCLLFMLIVMASLPTFATTYAGTYYVSPGETLRINNYAGANYYSSNNGSNWRWETRLVGSGWLGIDIVSKGLDYCDIKANEFLKNNNVELYFRYDYYLYYNSGVSQVEGFVCATL